MENIHWHMVGAPLVPSDEGWYVVWEGFWLNVNNSILVAASTTLPYITVHANDVVLKLQLRQWLKPSSINKYLFYLKFVM